MNKQDKDLNDGNNIELSPDDETDRVATNFFDTTSHSSHRRRHHSHSRKKKWSIRKKILVSIPIFFLCVIIALASTFLVLRHNGKKALLNYDNMSVNVPTDVSNANSVDDGRTINYNGSTYRFNENIASILFMGIDNSNIRDKVVPGNAGQSDALYLLTYDTNSGDIKVLCLNRDTITDINRYDESGAFFDTVPTQLCLAYAYGDGKKLSAQNQVAAVQQLLYNIPINAYYSIDLSAIGPLNDALGGIQVTPQYSFAEFTKGQTITLRGEAAKHFVKFRDISLLDDNLRRMKCQRQYLNNFANKAVSSIKKDISVPLDLYNATRDYTVTNIDTSELTYLASSLAFNFSGLNMITTTGKYKMVKGDSSAEFIIDKDKLMETVIDLFYIKIS